MRYYDGYTLRSAQRELTWKKLRRLLQQAYERPYDYSVWVEPRR